MCTQFMHLLNFASLFTSFVERASLCQIVLLIISNSNCFQYKQPWSVSSQVRIWIQTMHSSTSSQYFIESFISAQRVASNKIVIRKVFFDVAFLRYLIVHILLLSMALTHPNWSQAKDFQENMKKYVFRIISGLPSNKYNVGRHSYYQYL